MPSSVAIGPVDYSVQEDAEAIAQARLVHSDHRWAQTTKHLTRIDIDPAMSKSRKRETLLHECIHALIYEWNVNLGELPEEPLVESLGDAFLALIRDNPNLIKFLVEA